MKTLERNKDYINVINRIDNQEIVDKENKKVERNENIVIAIGLIAVIALFLFGAV